MLPGMLRQLPVCISGQPTHAPNSSWVTQRFVASVLGPKAHSITALGAAPRRSSAANQNLYQGRRPALYQPGAQAQVPFAARPKGCRPVLSDTRASDSPYLCEISLPSPERWKATFRASWTILTIQNGPVEHSIDAMFHRGLEAYAHFRLIMRKFNSRSIYNLEKILLDKNSTKPTARKCSTWNIFRPQA